MKPRTLLDKLLKLQRNYALTPRWIMTHERTVNIQDRFLKYKVNYEDIAIREPLLEHVGHLPIIASFLYPYIDHHESVDLGRALIMLSFHDIGETITGDVLKYKKTEKHEIYEQKVTKKLLNPYYIPYWEEYETRSTHTARFAKSVDSIAPLLHELDNMPHTLERWDHFGFGPDKIESKKRPDFIWDGVLLGIFEEYLKIVRSAYNNRA